MKQRTVLEVYKEVLSEAQGQRTFSENLNNGEKERDLALACARELYWVAKELENTHEVNPAYIELHPQDGIPLGEIVERDGIKYKVVDNWRTVITRAEKI